MRIVGRSTGLEKVHSLNYRVPIAEYLIEEVWDRVRSLAILTRHLMQGVKSRSVVDHNMSFKTTKSEISATGSAKDLFSQSSTTTHRRIPDLAARKVSTDSSAETLQEAHHPCRIDHSTDPAPLVVNSTTDQQLIVPLPLRRTMANGAKVPALTNPLPSSLVTTQLHPHQPYLRLLPVVQS